MHGEYAERLSVHAECKVLQMLVVHSRSPTPLPSEFKIIIILIETFENDYHDNACCGPEPLTVLGKREGGRKGGREGEREGGRVREREGGSQR